MQISCIKSTRTERQCLRLWQTDPEPNKAKYACAANTIAHGHFLSFSCMVLWFKEQLYCARETLMYVFN